jgi:hypothetical protein
MDLLDRLYRKLREVAARQFPAESTPSFTVAELYQQLIPYRGVRGELGVLELAEYEHALLRLLAGERGYVRVDSPQMQEELRKELSSLSPILGIYRDYADTRVELPPQPEAPTVPERPRPVPVSPPLPAPRPALVEPPSRTVACRSCRRPLPVEAELRFCPHCGADQREAACAQCGLKLQPQWNFCIRCGTPRESTPRAG